MKSRLIFSFSVALIFLSASIFTYSQEKPGTANKNPKQKQEKQITQISKPHKVKTVGVKSTGEKTTNQKMVKKSGRVKTRKVVKKETNKVESAKVLKHHKKMEKKLQKKESNNTPQKK